MCCVVLCYVMLLYCVAVTEARVESRADTQRLTFQNGPLPSRIPAGVDTPRALRLRESHAARRRRKNENKIPPNKYGGENSERPS